MLQQQYYVTGLLMDNIKKLKEIGLKKISEETHIEQKYLEYMVNSEFDKLNHINTLGFVKILSREYGIDLSAWAEAFEEYWQANREGVQDDGLFIVVENHKESKGFFGFFVLLVFIAVVAFGFSYFKDKLDLTQFTQQEEQQSYTPSDSVEETRASLEDFKREQASDTNTTQQSTPIPLDMNETENNESNESLVKDQLLTPSDANETQEKIIEEVVDEEIVKEQTLTEEAPLAGDVNSTQEASQNFGDTLMIEPKARLWVGVIYLDDFTRDSFLGEEPIALDLTREQIITTGHGSFDLRGEDYEESYSSQDPIRLWINDSNVTRITWNEFKELNQGSAW